MSVKLMAAAWDLNIGSTEKMVLMYLCDRADDEGGSCWPSIATICQKTSKGERTVQAAIKWLREAGYVDWDEAPGKGRSYTLDPRKICTPAEIAPPQKLHPRKSCASPPQNLRPTPAKSAPNTPEIHQDTPINPKPRARDLPDGWVPAEFGKGTNASKVIAGWPPGEVDRQIERFTLHHRKKGSRFCDWQAAWGTWVNASVEFEGRRNGRQQHPSGIGRTAAAAINAFGPDLGGDEPF